MTACETYAEAGTPPRLPHRQLIAAQAETLGTPRRQYGPAARLLFVTLDVIYGKKRTLSKFKVLELVARAPYQALLLACSPEHLLSEHAEEGVSR